MSLAAVLTYRDFLQSALIVDDEAFQRYDPIEVDEATLGADSVEDFLDEPSLEPLQAGEEAEILVYQNTYLRTKQVIEGFADAGINCAALEPDGPSDRDLKRTINLARRSDIVIVDWLLRRPDSVSETSGFQTDTGTSLELIRLILSEDAVSGKRVRLICIYTANPRLHSILEEIERVANALDLDFKINSERLRMYGRNTMILIIPKAHHSQPGNAVPCTEGDLPARLIKEFEDFVANGLLPRLALAGVAAIRAHTHRILARFGSNLDPALIGQRAMTSSVDAEHFALKLIGDELSALIDAAGTEEAVQTAHVEDRIAELLPNDSANVQLMNGSAPRIVTATEARQILVAGRGSDSKIQIGNQRVNLKGKSLTSLLYSGADALELADNIDDRFDMLSCLARSCEYDGPFLPAPIMQRGVILAEGSNYWLCLQPLCDSVRLVAPTRYPFLPLTTPTAERRYFEFVVLDGETNVRLSAGGARFGSVEFRKFVPDPNMQVVKATWEESSNSWTFCDESTAKFRWLGDLRPNVAQRTAVEIATNVGRLGVDETEHLRLNAR